MKGKKLIAVAVAAMGLIGVAGYVAASVETGSGLKGSERADGFSTPSKKEDFKTAAEREIDPALLSGHESASALGRSLAETVSGSHQDSTLAPGADFSGEFDVVATVQMPQSDVNPEDGGGAPCYAWIGGDGWSIGDGEIFNPQSGTQREYIRHASGVGLGFLGGQRLPRRGCTDTSAWDDGVLKKSETCEIANSISDLHGYVVSRYGNFANYDLKFLSAPEEMSCNENTAGMIVSGNLDTANYQNHPRRYYGGCHKFLHNQKMGNTGSMEHWQDSEDQICKDGKLFTRPAPSTAPDPST